MNKTEAFLINAMAAAIGARPLNDDLEGVDFHALLGLADFHNISIPLYYALTESAASIPTEFFEKLKKAQEFNSLKFAVTSAETEYLNRLFDKENIPYMLLKGSVIRALYPRPDMRTSCDVDYLINPQDCEKIEKLMLKSGFSFTTSNPWVDTYKKLPFVAVEIHRELMGGHKEFDCLLDLFDRGVPLENTRIGKKMCKDDFYIYTIVHIAKHITYGGSGIRPIMDMHLFLKNFEQSLDWDYINQRLASVNLATLEKELRTLCEHWFSGGEKSEITENLAQYILASGIFGTVNNSEVQQTVYKNKGVEISKRPSILKTAFLSYKNMTLRYPSLKKAPFLLPFYWVIRVADVLLHKREKIAPLLGKSTEITEAQVEKITDLFSKLGIINNQ